MNAETYYALKLEHETDSADVYDDLLNGNEAIVVVDCRVREFYTAAHIPGAINLPHRTLDAATTAALPKDALIVTYCDGIGCNASTKGALKFAGLGFRVKELLGGIDWWIRDGHPVASGIERGSLRPDGVVCGC